jgi:hypothetical protein
VEENRLALRRSKSVVSAWDPTPTSPQPTEPLSPEPFWTSPHPHDLFHRRPRRRVRLPAPLEERPPLGGEPDVFSVLWKRWPLPTQYLIHGSWDTGFREWYFSCENLDGEHPKPENVGGYRIHRCPRRTGRLRVANLRGEPPRVPNCWRSLREVGVGVKAGQPIIRQSSMAGFIDENVCLQKVNSEMSVSRT